ncbi:MAG: hypothetical protein ACTHMI_23510 [Mucilaginibacter sp.]
MEDTLITRSKLLYCSIKEWQVTLAFWALAAATEIVINVLS